MLGFSACSFVIALGGTLYELRKSKDAEYEYSLMPDDIAYAPPQPVSAIPVQPVLARPVHPYEPLVAEPVPGQI